MENIEKKERYFDEDYQHYMQFDFNLNENKIHNVIIVKHKDIKPYK